MRSKLKKVIIEDVFNKGRKSNASNSKDGRFTTSLVYNQQRSQLLVTLIKQSQLVVTKIVLKLTQRISQPPNTSRKETN